MWIVPGGRPLRVLDAGCGTGNYTLELRRRGHTVLGVDASDAMLGRAKEKVAVLAGCEFIEHDLTQPLPFDDDTFDAAITTMVLYALPYPGATVREIRRVVRSDGALVAVTMRTKVRVFGALGDAYRDHGLAEALRTFQILFGVGMFNLVINARQSANEYNLMETHDLASEAPRV